MKLYVDGLSFGGLTYGGGVASGAFVGPRHVLTVGHAFDTFSLKYPDVSVEAGASGDVATYKGNSSEVYFIGDGVGNDLALVVLPDSPEVAATGWFGMEVGVAKGEGMRIYGYPEWDQNCYSTSSNVWPRPNYPKCGAMSGKRYLYFDTCQVGEVFELANSVYYRCDTTKGDR